MLLRGVLVLLLPDLLLLLLMPVPLSAVGDNCLPPRWPSSNAMPVVTSPDSIPNSVDLASCCSACDGDSIGVRVEITATSSPPTSRASPQMRFPSASRYNSSLFEYSCSDVGQSTFVHQSHTRYAFKMGIENRKYYILLYLLFYLG